MRRLNPPDCSISVDGVEVPAREGESVATALLCETAWRGIYCGMGVCQLCLVTIDGVANRRACIEPVRPRTQVSLGGWEAVIGDGS